MEQPSDPHTAGFRGTAASGGARRRDPGVRREQPQGAQGRPQRLQVSRMPLRVSLLAPNSRAIPLTTIHSARRELQIDGGDFVHAVRSGRLERARWSAELDRGFSIGVINGLFDLSDERRFACREGLGINGADKNYE